MASVVPPGGECVLSWSPTVGILVVDPFVSEPLFNGPAHVVADLHSNGSLANQG
jgi:hypothetical protein